MNKYNEYMYFKEYLEDLCINEETHKCPQCGANLIVHYSMEPKRIGLNGFREIWICPGCK